MERIVRDYLLLNDLNDQYSEFIFLCIKEMNNNNEVILNAAIKNRIIEKLDIKIGSLNNMITRLVNEGIIIRTDRSVYKISDELERILIPEHEVAKIVLCYKKEDRTIKIEVGGSEE